MSDLHQPSQGPHCLHFCRSGYVLPKPLLGLSKQKKVSTMIFGSRYAYGAPLYGGYGPMWGGYGYPLYNGFYGGGYPVLGSTVIW